MTTPPEKDLFANALMQLEDLRMRFGHYAIPDAYFPVYEQILIAEEALYAAKRIFRTLNTF